MDKIERHSLVDEAYKRIRDEILNKEFSEGKKIPSENQLSKALNVSRVVIREALLRLREEKIIVTYHGKGSFLANPKNFVGVDERIDEQLDFSTFKDIIEFRECVETSAINLAVKVASDDELSDIKSCAQLLSAVQGDVDAFTYADYEFHLQIAKCSHNFLLVQSIENFSRLIKTSLKIMNSLSGSRDYAVELHKAVAEKICNRDGKGALELLKTNGEYNIARMSEIFNTQTLRTKQN